MPPTLDFLALPKAFSARRWHINRFVRWAAASLTPGSVILDAGAGECAYKPLFVHCRYIAIDVATGESTWDYRSLDAIALLDHLPFAANRFDAVLCTETLEHLEWPRESVAELHRVIRPGGRLFVTVPMNHSEHQVPYDYFRYTSFGLRSVLERAGFCSVRIAPLGTRLARWHDEIRFIEDHLAAWRPRTGLRSGHLRWRALPALTLLPLVAAARRGSPALRALLLKLEQYEPAPGAVEPCGWIAVATK
jgi:SAM-dependent methyltransferase